jgi:hypothetical protein
MGISRGDGGGKAESGKRKAETPEFLTQSSEEKTGRKKAQKAQDETEFLQQEATRARNGIPHAKVATDAKV